MGIKGHRASEEFDSAGLKTAFYSSDLRINVSLLHLKTHQTLNNMYMI